MRSEVFTLIDILGTAAFSISGVFAAMQKKLDVFGVLIIAFITAIGGGTLRDLLIGDTPVSWMRTGNYSLVIFLSAAIAILFHNHIKNYSRILLLFDSIGIGFFTIVGLQKGIAFNFSPGFCIALGTITACFGGLIRDITLNRIPQIFHKEIYATPCIIGGILYFILRTFPMAEAFADTISIAVILTLRLLAAKYNWSLPSIYREDR